MRSWFLGQIATSKDPIATYRRQARFVDILGMLLDYATVMLLGAIAVSVYCGLPVLKMLVVPCGACMVLCLYLQSMTHKRSGNISSDGSWSYPDIPEVLDKEPETFRCEDVHALAERILKEYISKVPGARFGHFIGTPMVWYVPQSTIDKWQYEVCDKSLPYHRARNVYLKLVRLAIVSCDGTCSSVLATSLYGMLHRYTDIESECLYTAAWMLYSAKQYGAFTYLYKRMCNDYVAYKMWPVKKEGS